MGAATATRGSAAADMGRPGVDAEVVAGVWCRLLPGAAAPGLCLPAAAAMHTEVWGK